MEYNLWERGIKLWERGIRCGIIRRQFRWNKKMQTWNKNRISGINVSLREMKGGITRGIMWNKK